MRPQLPSGGDQRRVVEVVDARAVGRRVAVVAARQHGVVTRAQLVALGVSAAQVKRWVHVGWLRRLHRGVYLVGAVAPDGALEHAAVLACGEDAYASHETAATLHGLPLPAQPGGVHVTVVNRDVSRPGINVHRTQALVRQETAVVDRIAVTSPARTIVDLAAELGEEELEHVLAQAYAKNLVSRAKVLAVVARHPTRSGTRTLRRLLEPNFRPALTRSKAERRFLALVRKSKLAEPRVNARIDGYEVDFFWPGANLVVEVDGHAFHAAKPQRERDSTRDQILTAHGRRVLRVTWHHIDKEPEALAARVAAAIASGRREAG
jgi:very-short-patch-repair endonuclease